MKNLTKKGPIIAFVHLPVISSYEHIFDFSSSPPYLCMPLGILYLSATLKECSNPSNVFIFDYALAATRMREGIESGKVKAEDYQDNPSRFILEIAREATRGIEPDLIAVSLMFSPSRSIALLIVENLKKLWPKAVTVFGGNHATNDVPDLLAHPDIDFVCRGEADFSFPQFVNQLAVTDRPKVNGYYCKKDIEEGKPLCVSSDSPENLDEVPFPDWNLIDVASYQEWKVPRTSSTTTEEHVAKNISIITSRGCPFGCTFCASSTVHGRKMRYRSVENVLGEMREAYDRFGVNLFAPEDDMFHVQKKRTLALLGGIKKLHIPNLEIQFPSTFNVNTMEEEVIDALKDAGMKIFSLAIESGSPYTQVHLIKKRVNLNKAKRLVKYATEEKNLYTRINFILGFPNEKIEHIQETIDFCKNLGADWNNFMIATPLQGTEMFDQFNEMGVLNFETRNWEKSYLDRDFDTEDFKAEELVEIAYRANLDVNFIHNRQMRAGNWKLAQKVFNEITTRHPFHIIAHYYVFTCLKNLGKHEEAKQRLEKIQHLVSTTNDSKEMLKKYGDMFPNLVKDLRFKQHKSSE